MIVDKYDKLKFATALRVRSLNALGVKVGDRVAVRLGYEPDEDKRYAVPKEIIGDVAEIDAKGRWFRVITNEGFSRCCLFASTYDNGRKFGYRIIGRK